MTTAEFPKKPIDDALLRLAMAVVAEGTEQSTGAVQAKLARTYGSQAGFSCTTARAEAGLGAFIADLVGMGGPRDTSSMIVAFQGWHGTAEDQADLAEFGCNGNERSWLESRMETLRRFLWDGGSPHVPLHGTSSCQTTFTPHSAALE